MENRFRKALEKGEFVVTCEMIPGRGAFEFVQEQEYENMKAMYSTGRVHAISITDCPSGNPAISSPGVARRFMADGVLPLVHFTCKDRSRNMMQGELYEMQYCGLENLLVMTGDFQSTGFEGAARPNFDLDPVNTLRLVSAMNEGLVVRNRGREMRETPSNFFAGAVVNPFKYREGEIMPQYYKLEKKLAAGAQFIISQLGYDACKMQELLQYTRGRGYEVPLIANVFLLTKGAARMMRAGKIPGCYISSKLLIELEKESALNASQPGYAREKRIERAAKMVAIARGMGYSGVHIGGFGLDTETLIEVLDRADAYAGDWQACAAEISYGRPGGFYLYESEIRQKDCPNGESDEEISGRELFRRFELSRVFHKLVLDQKYDDEGHIIERKGLNHVLAKVMDELDSSCGDARSHKLEHTSKVLLYGCLDCGDCGLESVAYSCPMAACPKSQRNGPCGGSNDGYCEIFPRSCGKGARFCVHYLAYHRFKRAGELEKYTDFITPPNNWAFWEHSAWSNYTHGRDNCSKRVRINRGDGPCGRP